MLTFLRTAVRAKVTQHMPILACFVGAAAAAPTKHARIGTFVRMLGDFSTYSRVQKSQRSVLR
jgi:alkanesulfonate monooxygenase SsuD/methylene tetrahydromethanopterin reductase-like flavin-dependent oxidoreductase (luciferase family)